MNALLGLVIHGLADGIALGASSLSDRSSLGVIVFLAVLVHKGEWSLYRFYGCLTFWEQDPPLSASLRPCSPYPSLPQ